MTHFRWRENAVRLAMVATSIGMVMIGVEGLFRLTGNFGINLWEVYDPGSDDRVHGPGETFEYRGVFGNPREFAARVRLNSLGYNAPEPALEPPATGVRIALLGDSYVEAMQVEQSEQVRAVLEGQLRALGAVAEVLAFGKSGIGQVGMAEIMRRDVLRFRPHIVVAEFLAANDVLDNDPALRRMMPAKGFDVRGGAVYALARRLRLQSWGLALHRLDALAGAWGNPEPFPFPYFVYLPRRWEAAWERAWARTEEAFLRLRGLAGLVHARLVIAAFSSRQQILAHLPDGPAAVAADTAGYVAKGIHFDFAAPDGRVEAFAAREGIAFVNLSRVFAALPEDLRAGLHFRGDGHWTAMGHHAAGVALAQYLMEMGMVAGAAPPP